MGFRDALLDVFSAKLKKHILKLLGNKSLLKLPCFILNVSAKLTVVAPKKYSCLLCKAFVIPSRSSYFALSRHYGPHVYNCVLCVLCKVK